MLSRAESCRLIVAALLISLGCEARHPHPPGAEVTAPTATASGLRTTDPAIALANLTDTIAARERDLAVTNDSRHAFELQELILTRAQFLGRVSDLERALALGERLVREATARAGDARLARARALSAFHRFDEALADLEAAARQGADSAGIERARAAALAAIGRYHEALAIRRGQAWARPGISAIGAEAATLAEMGRSEEASARFRDAMAAYRDVSPFPVAWIEFQEGVMWMREGKPDRARPLLEAAHARLPAYAAAAGHLGEVEAALGNPRRAIELLKAAWESSGDPDPAGQLARVLADSGFTREAEAWRERAAVGFRHLVVRHPEAFADHAAEFWLGPGGEPGLALRLARRNAALRPTPRALELLVRAKGAANARVKAASAHFPPNRG